MPARLLQLTVVLLLGLQIIVLGPTQIRASMPAVRLIADQAPASVSIDIFTITPLSPGPKDTLRITGRVRGNGGPAITRVKVSLHLGRSVTSRTELHGLRAQPVPQEIATKQQDIGDGRLAAGKDLPFTLQVPVADLQLPAAGVYPMQVTAIGVEEGTFRDLATASTFLPYIPPEKTTSPTPLAWLVALTPDPSVLANGALTSDHGSSTIGSVAPGGRLRKLLDALSASRASAASIDPAVVQALTVAGSGRYFVAGGTTGNLSDPPIPRPASADAAKWIADLRSAANVALVGLPYADPDVEALLHSGQGGLADEARMQGADVLKVGLLSAASRLAGGVAVAPDGALDIPGATYYARNTNAKAVVVAGATVPATGDNPSAAVNVAGVPTRLLVADDVLTDLSKFAGEQSPRLQEQELIAELAEAHLEDRAAGAPTESAATSTARPLLIAPPADWDPPGSWGSQLLSDTARLPWLKQVPVSALLSSQTEPRAQLTYPPAAAQQELPASVTADSANLLAKTNGLFPRTPPPDTQDPRTPKSILRPIRDAALEAVSTRWRTDVAGSQVFRDSADATFNALQQQVRVVASRQVTLTSRAGRVPVTIENNLDAAVDVKLVLTSLDRSRVSSGTVLRRTVRAGQKVQVEVAVKAASAGTFPVQLALFSPSGEPLGSPAQVLVRSTTYGVVATIFTGVALGVLSLAVLIRAIRALSRRSRKRTASGKSVEES